MTEAGGDTLWVESTRDPDGYRTLAPGTAETLILYRCQCSRVHVEAIAGKWTLAQVAGKGPA